MNTQCDKVLTKEFLEEEYLHSKKSAQQISDETGFSYVCIQTRIRKFQIPRRPQYDDLTGNIYGKLTVIRFSHSTDKHVCYWECCCECGKTKIAKAHNLKNGELKSCGCLNRSRVGDMSGTFLYNMRAHAKARGKVFSVTSEQIWSLYESQSRRCALTGQPIFFDPIIKKNTTASLDRIDSSKGYELSNIQWVHKDINKLKTDFEQSRFVELCGLVARHHASK